jgi:asparagine synthase (glutamine-hydrolysing)
MCGIFGILSSSRFVSEDLLRKAVSTLAHRGPDDAGTVIIQDSPSFGLQLGLAHTRLSIIDLSPLGHQPMQDPATGNWLVFNGEIYNFRELRNELSALGADFKSHSDTEVILAAYRVWGESCLERLQGMFALALWDAPRKQLLLVRDPMGIKPLYYHQSNQAFIFASEVRTFLRTGLVPRKVDSTGLLSYLEFGSVYEPWTIVEGIRAVPPGCALTLQNRSVSSRRYWTPLHSPSFAPSVPSSGNGNVATDRLPSLLRHAVLSHLVSDVPVGVFLSGGIDSSAIVAILSLNGVRANTFSLVFQEEEFNEAQYSREIARYFRTEHHEIPLLPQDALAVLPEALCAMDQPTIDGINTYLVSAKTRAAGVKVALTGLGADEMFAGYSNFRRVPKMELFSKGLRQLPRLARRPLALSIGLFAGKGDRSRKVSDLATDSRSVLHPYFLARMLFGKAEREALFSRSDSFASQQSLDKCLQESAVESQSLDPVNRVSYFESIFYMRNTLLRDSDFMSMAHGLELRVPFLDKSLVEDCFRIPGKRKLQGTLPKSLLLASLGVELPSEIVNRPKRGFTLPFERWLRRDMRSTVQDALLKGNWDQIFLDAGVVRKIWSRFLAGETSWSRPWSLFVLKRWCDENL